MNGSGPARVGIIIAAYNCERFLGLTLESIQAQTLRDWECVVVDDGSKDRTLETAQRFAAGDGRIRVLTQQNQGPSVARNTGLAAISPGPEFLTFMDADDLWVPEALSLLVGEIESHPGAVGAYGRARCIDQDGRDFEDPAYTTHGNGRFVCDRSGRVAGLDPSAPTSFRSLWFSNPFPPGLALARRPAYDKTGGFDTAVCPVEDWDILIRLSREGGFQFLDRVVLSYRRHAHNTSVLAGTKTLRKIRLLQHKTFFAPENNAAQKQIVRENWRGAQLLSLRQKWAAAGDHFAKGRFPKALAALASSAVPLCRFARGYPTRRGI